MNKEIGSSPSNDFPPCLEIEIISFCRISHRAKFLHSLQEERVK